MTEDSIQIDLLSHAHHLNQILTGFHLYAAAEGRKLIIEDHSKDDKYQYKKTALVAQIDGKRIVYDMADGYQSVDVMKYLLSIADFYFKRSYSDLDNRTHGLEHISPLGMNYDVTWFGNPLSYARKLGKLRTILEGVSGKLITPQKIAQEPQKKDSNHRILFCCRLWPKDEKLTEKENEERMNINQARIEIIRALKQEYKTNFIGGVERSSLAMQIAPDLILNPKMTKRCNYLNIMRKSNICIATAGLHKSTGGKMGEYVAASRAIVSEKIYYTVPGDFAAGRNYLEFETAAQCLEHIHDLLLHPDRIYEMQRANKTYYQDYLDPEQLIRNSLKTAGMKG